MRSRSRWALKDIFRLLEETQCSVLDVRTNDFIKNNIKENFNKLIHDSERFWVALPLNFPWSYPHNDSLVLAFTYDSVFKKYVITSFYPTVRIKEDNGDYFLDVVTDETIMEEEYYNMVNYSVDEMIEHIKNMIRKCTELTKMIRLMNVKNCTKEWET